MTWACDILHMHAEAKACCSQDALPNLLVQTLSQQQISSAVHVRPSQL